MWSDKERWKIKKKKKNMYESEAGNELRNM